MVSRLNFYFGVFLTTTLLIASPILIALDGGMSEYPLGAGDMISIKVFGEADLSHEIRLSDTGTIAYPFLGELTVSGLTTGRLSELIRSQLADGYLVNPSVNVSVVEYRQFYIHGQVKSPGGYPYQPGLSLQKAVALAGGFTERASRSKMYLVPEGGGPRTGLRLDSKVSPGDIITIEESFF